jgi:hypothetical protein
MRIKFIFLYRIANIFYRDGLCPIHCHNREKGRMYLIIDLSSLFLILNKHKDLWN